MLPLHALLLPNISTSFIALVSSVHDDGLDVARKFELDGTVELHLLVRRDAGGRHATGNNISIVERCKIQTGRAHVRWNSHLLLGCDADDVDQLRIGIFGQHCRAHTNQTRAR